MSVFHFYSKNLCCRVCQIKYAIFGKLSEKVQGGIRQLDHYVPEVICLLYLTTLNNSGFNKQIILNSNKDYNRGC